MNSIDIMSKIFIIKALKLIKAKNSSNPFEWNSNNKSFTETRLLNFKIWSCTLLGIKIN